jgi:hypothetical protein
LVAGKEDSADIVAALLTAKADPNVKYGVLCMVLYCADIYLNNMYRRMIRLLFGMLLQRVMLVLLRCYWKMVQ